MLRALALRRLLLLGGGGGGGHARRQASAAAGGGGPQLFASRRPTDRSQRMLAATVKESLTQTLASGIIKDRGMDDGAAVHVIDVQVARKGLVARVLWEPMRERDDAERVQRALERKCGILRAHVNSYVNKKSAISIEFVRAPREAAEGDDAGQSVRAAFFAELRADLAASAQRRSLQGREEKEEEKDGPRETTTTGIGSTQERMNDS